MSQLSLLQNTDHDPGGKVRIPLPQGMHGGAEFYGPNDCYRLWLARRWSYPGNLMDGFVLWIGMNPSTANATVDDPTVKREVGFTHRWGYRHYLKCNVMDYRATKPKALLAPGLVPCSDRNLSVIRDFAADAARIVIVHGRLLPRLQCFGKAVVDALIEDGRQLNCLGFNNDGSPLHPLYLKGETPLIPFRRAT